MNDKEKNVGPLFWGQLWSSLALLLAGMAIYDGQWMGAIFALVVFGPPYFFIVFGICFPALADRYNKQIAVVFAIWAACLGIFPLLIFWPISLVMALLGGIFWFACWVGGGKEMFRKRANGRFLRPMSPDTARGIKRAMRRQSVRLKGWFRTKLLSDFCFYGKL